MLARMTLPAVGASTCASGSQVCSGNMGTLTAKRSEEHTSELQSPCNLVCRLLLEKKKKKTSHVVSCTKVIKLISTHANDLTSSLLTAFDRMRSVVCAVVCDESRVTTSRRLLADK